MNRFIKVGSALVALSVSAAPVLAEGPCHPAPEHYGNRVSVTAPENYSAREGIALGLKGAD